VLHHVLVRVDVRGVHEQRDERVLATEGRLGALARTQVDGHLSGAGAHRLGDGGFGRHARRDAALLHGGEERRAGADGQEVDLVGADPDLAKDGGAQGLRPGAELGDAHVRAAQVAGALDLVGVLAADHERLPRGRLQLSASAGRPRSATSRSWSPAACWSSTCSTAEREGRRTATAQREGDAGRTLGSGGARRRNSRSGAAAECRSRSVTLTSRGDDPAALLWYWSRLGPESHGVSDVHVRAWAPSSKDAGTRARCSGRARSRGG